MTGISEFVEHPLIKPETLQSRLYQQSILGRAVKENLLVVLPTALGKTPIAVMLTAHRLEKFPDSSVMVLAPTKPLTGQHFASFKKFMKVDGSGLQVITGEMKPKEREGLYRTKRIIFATPQTVRNDLRLGRLDLSGFSLLVVDEAHHAIGGYAYPYIAKKYKEQSDNPKIIALTASPGATQEKISEICDNLEMAAVEIKTEADRDVRPYVKSKQMEQSRVSLPESFLEIRKLMDDVYRRKLKHLRKFGFTKPEGIITKKDLLMLRTEFMGRIRSGNRSAFAAISVVTQGIKLEHALGLLETQGINPLLEYLEKLGKDKSKAARIVMNEKSVQKAIRLTRKLSEKGSSHPKVAKLCSIVDQELGKNESSRIIVFANYRSSVREIVTALSKIGNARPVKFIGQREGVTQKEQLETIRRFRDGEFNILVCTSVGEEGLDIPSANLAIFYEPVPSPLRSIQRRGRVGRADIGRVILLITEGTRDEGYYWTAHHREKKMKRILKGMKKGKRPVKPKNLADFG